LLGFRDWHVAVAVVVNGDRDGSVLMTGEVVVEVVVVVVVVGSATDVRSATNRSACDAQLEFDEVSGSVLPLAVSA
jgi:hypothetical protein